MVVFQIKRGDGDCFLYETSCESSADQTVREITEIWNLRLRLGQLCGGIRELARHGPMKPPDKAGLDEVRLEDLLTYQINQLQQIAEKYNGEVIARNEYYSPDPTGSRTGNGVGPQLSDTIERVAMDAEEAISKVIETPDFLFNSFLESCCQKDCHLRSNSPRKVR
jgi:cilia- and flagella-associated protein 298